MQAQEDLAVDVVILQCFYFFMFSVLFDETGNTDKNFWLCKGFCFPLFWVGLGFLHLVSFTYS